MLRILVDTCVWQHWFTLKINPTRLSATLRVHSESFNAIYQLIATSSSAEFLFNALVVHELGAKHEDDFAKYVAPVSKKIPIPLSRTDGLYKCDGSILSGGRTGGSLNAFLNADGYSQEEMIQNSAGSLSGEQKLYETKPRKRELDVEHMESALEANADIFLTNDERTIIERLQRLGRRYPDNHPINMILAITSTPTSALPKIQEIIRG
ncbi:MAG: hypothetical protein HGA87_04235 [Desulfobulbaceae bacterium]|nr:hypothetical protein [Desulfobulbaceae bacterium]